MRVNINKLHAMLGYGNEERDRKIVKYFGFEVTRGRLKPCTACTAAKAKKECIAE